MKLLEVITEASYKASDKLPLQEMDRMSRKYKFVMERTVDWDQHGTGHENLKNMMAPRKLVVTDKRGEPVGEYKDLDQLLETGLVQ